eukprot:TRINITY_DN10135_c0_g2_i1.p1 TRINITY_DN10135_c0_g2~~TRINITY_DN10135_c0_g2_i1.p1  ORF type:complete len:202 (-),score=41.49 TRINITY_DN10135_c0_g2_i1:34-639(-)
MQRGLVGSEMCIRDRVSTQSTWVFVLLCASIPNPLFDLAGITCGHFLVPFGIFLGAVSIGKALIKATLQSIFMIVMFSKHHAEALISFIETTLPFLGQSISQQIKNWKQNFFKPPVEEEKLLIAKIWDIFIFLMIGYFILSCINSLAQTYASRLEEHSQKTKKSKSDQLSPNKKKKKTTNITKKHKTTRTNNNPNHNTTHQ